MSEPDPAHPWTGRRAVAGRVLLSDGPHGGHTVWTPAGPLRPWLLILEPDPGTLIAVRLWQPPATTGHCRTVYYLTDRVHEGRPVYALERRRHPR